MDLWKVKIGKHLKHMYLNSSGGLTSVSYLEELRINPLTALEGFKKME